MTIFSRAWAMPNHNTFSIRPIREFIDRHLRHPSVDPFARNSKVATHTNDINPKTSAEHHMDAEEFLKSLASADAATVLFDPPYSPRQISECYSGFGKRVTEKETQSAVMYARVRDAIPPILRHDGKVLSFGWNSVGMGKKHGFRPIEIMLVCHGGAHNDTICVAEERMR